eukprot:m.27168 g.27168  ORF g.27168 m.27168 type:complete len:762 (+) comp7870_c0_seq1:224-2509(+)
MKLELCNKVAKHNDVVAALGWSGQELFSAGDDHIVRKSLSDTSEEVANLGEEAYPTVLDFLPAVGKKTGSDFCAVGGTDGKFRFVSRSGRLDKTVEAHRGAITSLRWSPDGSALVTAGEDGFVKIWSRNGMLRSQLAQTGVPVYAADWSPSGESIAYTTGQIIVVKPLQPSAKTEQWKAHEGVILSLDWNSVNSKIVTGGEDRKYKVWDAYGQLLFSSSVHDHSITTVRWSLDGQLFAVGSYNMIRLCDQAGWSHNVDRPKSGTVYAVSWAADGTRFGIGCANGDVFLANVLEQQISWRNFELKLKTQTSLEVQDLKAATTENLTDFRDRIVKMSLKFDHLIVATTSQCLVYKTTNWHTPVVFDLKEGTLQYIKQARDHFMLVVAEHGLQIYSYEGRMISSPKLGAMNTEMLNEDLVSLTNDVIAIRDQRDPKSVHILDVASGMPIGKPIVHTNELISIRLDQGFASLNRHLAVVDKNRDIFVCLLRQSRGKLAKLGTMVQSLMWHDENGMLTAVSNGKFVVWFFPTVAFIDPEILSKTRFERDASEYGKAPIITQFSGNTCTLKRTDGAMMLVNILPYPSMLYKHVNARNWDDAIRLCRVVKNPTLWACLAAMAAVEKELNAAEIAYAAIEEVDKVQHIARIKKVPTLEGRNAEMALFCRQFEEAEATLIQAGLIFRAIEMNCLSFQWERALELAKKNSTHVATVVGWRQQYIGRLDVPETLENFVKANEETEVDWDKINQSIEQEAENERSRPGAVPYS